MTFWHLEPTDPAPLHLNTAIRALANAFGSSVRTVWQHHSRLELGWPAFIEADSCDVEALEPLHVVVRACDRPETVSAAPEAAKELGESWVPFRTALEPVAPEALAALNPPALQVDRRAVERGLGVSLPRDFVAWLALHDGGDSVPGPFDWRITSLASSMRAKNSLDDLPAVDSDLVEADDGVASVWWHRRWFPFAENGAGDRLCIDLAPTGTGRIGQILEYRHDDGARRLVARSFLQWIDAAAADFYEGRIVATETDHVFFGMVPRAEMKGRLASLRIRGESVQARTDRVEREILSDPLELAMQVVSRLRNHGLLDLVPDARCPSPELYGLHLDLAEGLRGTRPTERARAIQDVLMRHPAVVSFATTLDDIAMVIAESAR